VCRRWVGGWVGVCLIMMTMGETGRGEGRSQALPSSPPLRPHARNLEIVEGYA